MPRTALLQTRVESALAAQVRVLADRANSTTSTWIANVLRREIARSGAADALAPSVYELAITLGYMLRALMIHAMGAEPAEVAIADASATAAEEAADELARANALTRPHAPPRTDPLMLRGSRPLAFGTADEATADYLSRLTGQATVRVETLHHSRGSTSGRGWLPNRQHGTGQNYGETGRRLLLPDEIRRLPPDRQVLFLAGQPPLLTTRVDYRHHPTLAPRADPNPIYAAAPFRRPRER